MQARLRSTLGGLLPAVLVACAGLAGAPPTRGPATAQVTGSVTYLQRVALDPTAVVKVQLIDVSRADAAATVLGEQTIQAGGRQVPFAFEIAYDPAKIDSNHSYAVAARIEDGGKLLFINDRRYAVITRGAPARVEMLLRAVGASAPVD
jgi:putative lipoprotein